MKIDELIRTRRKTVSIFIATDGRVVVRAPLHATKAQIQVVVDNHEEWIRLQQEKARRYTLRTAPKTFQNGEMYWYLGEQYPLEITPSATPPLRLNGRFYLSEQALPQARELFTAWYRQQARRVLTERTRLYAEKYVFAYQQVKISSARTRWGSCSSRGSLSYTWRLVMAPLPVVDYVVHHELVHLEYRNHSKAYWGRLGELMPEYKQHIAWLKEHGAELTL